MAIWIFMYYLELYKCPKLHKILMDIYGAPGWYTYIPELHKIFMIIYVTPGRYMYSRKLYKYAKLYKIS